MTKIKDIYAGKPDAKDEIETEGMDPFFENYVVPSNFNINAITDGSGAFVTGYKGTGKTAILFYIEKYLRKKDDSTLSSFIFFKGDYSDSKKQEMEILAKRLTSIISIGNDVVLSGTDFEYIWRWLFYSRIIKDNQDYNYGIFENNDSWIQFEKKMKQIDIGKRKGLSIPPKLSLSLPISDTLTQATISPTFEIDFKDSKMEESASYRTFIQIIDDADELFKNLKRTDIPYFIFVDELEAYFGDETVFKRDLRLIRDLIFTAKKMNMVFAQNKKVKTKIVCSVRTEIINAINRFVVTKELNKVISGFEVPLIWDYTNTNSYNHPIIKILTSRISYGEKKLGNSLSEQEIIKKWFPEKIGSSDAATYILNNCWCKPRDIVRLITSAQNCLAAENDSFSQKTIDMSKKRYSQDSLTELKEELLALYSPDEINRITTCLTGFKRIFSVDELSQRVNKYYSEIITEKKLPDILSDLYRIGFIGNHIPETRSYRWQHKGDDGIILDGAWKIIIHSALTSALSVNSKQDKILSTKDSPKIGIVVDVNIKSIWADHALGEFINHGHKYKAKIIKSPTLKKDFSSLVAGDSYKAKLIQFNFSSKTWLVELI